MSFPCMFCNQFSFAATNVHFDHVHKERKLFRIVYLMDHNIASKPNRQACVNDDAFAMFDTCYDAFFFELPNLCILCSRCHSRKTYAENEIAALLAALP